jgi:hypothetical protein
MNECGQIEDDFHLRKVRRLLLLYEAYRILTERFNRLICIAVFPGTVDAKPLYANRLQVCAMEEYSSKRLIWQLSLLRPARWLSG